MKVLPKKTRRPKQFSVPQRESWDFSPCPIEQRRACYLYEYSIESEFVRAEVEAVRKKWLLRESPSVKKRIDDFWRCDPIPPPGSPEREDWNKRRQEAIPEAIVPTTLPAELYFLFDC